jgi:hypothetical protein
MKTIQIIKTTILVTVVAMGTAFSVKAAAPVVVDVAVNTPEAIRRKFFPYEHEIHQDRYENDKVYAADYDRRMKEAGDRIEAAKSPEEKRVDKVVAAKCKDVKVTRYSRDAEMWAHIECGEKIRKEEAQKK